MPAGLFHHPVARIHQNQRQVCRGSPGNHVPGILNMTRRISDDKLPLRRSKVAVGHVNGNTLLPFGLRSEEHTSELQSLMRISYAVFCLKTKNIDKTNKLQSIPHHSH